MPSRYIGDEDEADAFLGAIQKKPKSAATTEREGDDPPEIDESVLNKIWEKHEALYTGPRATQPDLGKVGTIKQIGEHWALVLPNGTEKYFNSKEEAEAYKSQLS